MLGAASDLESHADVMNKAFFVGGSMWPIEMPEVQHKCVYDLEWNRAMTTSCRGDCLPLLNLAWGQVRFCADLRQKT